MFEDGGIPNHPLCNETSAMVSVAGDWSFTGSVTYEDCDGRGGIVEGRVYTMKSPAPLAVVQEGSLLSSTGDGPLSLTGRASGNCVNVVIEDQDPKTGEVARYEYSGLGSAGSITGNFTGQGPQGCDSKGSLRVSISP